MKQKRESLLLIALPIIAAFVYVVSHKLIDNASLYDQAPLYEQFYFFVITTAILHVLWGFTIILICLNAYENIRFWRILTTFIIIEAHLLFVLAVEMSLLMSQYLYYRDSNIPVYNRDYIITWSAVSMACLWFDFIVFLLIIIRHIYWYEEFVPLKVEDPSRMERR